VKTKQEIQAIIDRMSPAQKAGQLFLLAYPGKDPGIIKPLIETYGLCGCYISQDNAETFAEAQSFTAGLQTMSMANHNLPLLLGVDQEGAWGVLVPESHTGPGNLALGAAMDENIVRDMYRSIGKEMLSVGYNTVLGPCADVNSNPRSPIIGARSFGEFPERVARCVDAGVRGLLSSGILATVKHFPGHGATEVDTHRLIPEVNKSLDELRKQDLFPFMAGIKAGVQIVMTSHIKYPQVDPEHPATLSKKILEELLRKEMGFSGIILSDSMNMGAIRKFYDPAESTLLALKAGVDVVMLAEEHYDYSDSYLQKQLDSIEIVKQAIESGKFQKDQVNEKLYRILDLKLNYMQVKSPALSGGDKDEIVRIETQAARAGFVLLRKGLWPLPEEGLILCVNATPRESYKNIMNIRGIGPNQAVPAFDSFKETYEKLEKEVRFAGYEDIAGTGKPAAETAALLKKAAALVIVTEDYPLPGEDFQKEKQQSLVKKLSEKYGAKTIILGLRSSYELSLYPESVTYLCAYSSRTCSAHEGAVLLAERRERIPGTAPVTPQI
jgi:beta-N-acetylhexosaminidase